jgi:hypothetical protein
MDKERVNPRVNVTVDLFLHIKMLNYGWSPSECINYGIQQKILAHEEGFEDVELLGVTYKVHPAIKAHIEKLVARVEMLCTIKEEVSAHE